MSHSKLFTYKQYRLYVISIEFSQRRNNVQADGEAYFWSQGMSFEWPKCSFFVCLFVCLFFAVICIGIQHILWWQDRFIISLWTSSIFLKQGQVSGEGGFSFHFTISHCWFSLRYLLKVLIHWKRGHAFKVDKKDWANLEASTGNHQQNALNSQISHKFWT